MSSVSKKALGIRNIAGVAKYSVCRDLAHRVRLHLIALGPKQVVRRTLVRRDTEISHYDRLGRLARSNDRTGFYVLQIVWHRIGQDLRLTEKFGWLKAAPTQRVEFKTWKELWDWVAKTIQTSKRLS